MPSVSNVWCRIPVFSEVLPQIVAYGAVICHPHPRGHYVVILPRTSNQSKPEKRWIGLYNREGCAL